MAEATTAITPPASRWGQLFLGVTAMIATGKLQRIGLAAKLGLGPRP